MRVRRMRTSCLDLWTGEGPGEPLWARAVCARAIVQCTALFAGACGARVCVRSQVRSLTPLQDSRYLLDPSLV